MVEEEGYKVEDDCIKSSQHEDHNSDDMVNFNRLKDDVQGKVV